MQRRFKRTWSFIQKNKFNPVLFRSLDWFMLLLMLSVALFGVVSIFAATAKPVEQQLHSFLEMVSTQPVEYARLQFIWIIVGMALMGVVLYFDYHLFGDFSNWIYWINIGLLLLVLTMEAGRGNMAGWFRWGADATRTIQPSEFGKLAIIIALAKRFSSRSKPISSVAELIPVLAYVGLPLVLILAQPDVGTAMVYIVIFGVMLFVSGTDVKLIVGILAIGVVVLVVVWYVMSQAENDFRFQRIQVFLDPTLDTSGAGMQMANARTAVGSGGMWGKGLFSVGSYASLDYIPDDYTDFIFAIVCETFGYAGTAVLISAYVVMLTRMLIMSLKAVDAFGRYLIIGYMSMLFFHIAENIGMVIGLLPVTGIPLSFVSYGGSNLLTNMLGFAIVLNVSMRSKNRKIKPKPRKAIAL